MCDKTEVSKGLSLEIGECYHQNYCYYGHQWCTNSFDQLMMLHLRQTILQLILLLMLQIILYLIQKTMIPTDEPTLINDEKCFYISLQIIQHLIQLLIQQLIQLIIHLIQQINLHLSMPSNDVCVLNVFIFYV